MACLQILLLLLIASPAEVPEPTAHGHALGWVIDSSGLPVDGARVRLEPASIDLRRWPLSHPTLEARSDSEGAYRFDGVAYGPYRLQASAEGRLDSEAQEIELTPDQPRAEVTLMLEPGVDLSGIALDAAAGTPLAGVEIQAFPLQRPDNQRASRSGADGRFVIRGLPSGPLRLYAQAENFAPLRGLQSEAPAEGIELRLAAPANLRGAVLDRATRQPVASFQLGLRRLDSGDPVGENAADHLAYPFDSPSGRFRVEGLAPGRYEIEVAAAQLATARFQVELPSAAPIELALEPACRLSGRVTDAAGQPVAGAAVALASHPSPRYLSDPNGRFELPDLAPGSARLIIRHPDFAPATLGPYQLAPQQPLEIEARLTPGARIEGWAFDAEGEPAAGGVVAARAPDGSLARAGVGPYGFYRTDALAPGHYKIALIQRFQPLELGGAEQHQIDLEESEVQQVDFGVRGCRVDGVVRMHANGAGGGLLRWTPALADRTDAPIRELRIGRDGGFRTPPLVPGLYQVALLSATQDRLVQIDTVVVPQQAQASIDLELGAQILRGQVQAAGGPPLRGATVEARGPAGELLGWVRSDSAGRFELRGLMSHAALVQATAAGYLPLLVRPAAPSAGSELDLGTLPLSRGAVLTGRVLGAAGPVAGAELLLEGERDDPTVRRVETGPAGQYRIEGLGSGPFALTVRHEQHAPLRQAGIELEIGAERELELRLGNGAVLLIEAFGADGAPLEGVRLELEPLQPLVEIELGEAATDGSGIWQRSRLEPGLYRIRAERDGITQSAQFELREGRRTKLSFRW